LTIAITAPTATKKTMATCIQIHVGDTPSSVWQTR
jgi:hypothetical protein